MNDKEYEERERQIFERDMTHQLVTRKERLDAQATWISDLSSDPELVADRIDWLLAGHYGKGAYDAAWKAVNSNFVKPTTFLLEVIAVLEWSVPRSFVGRSYAKLSAEQYAKVISAVEAVVARAKANRQEEEM